MRLSKNAALSAAQILFTIKSAYRAGVLFVGFAYHKISSMPIPLQAKFATSAQWLR